MKQLTVARLREVTHALELPLEDDELARLKPMVEDLLAVARRLRRYHTDIAVEPNPGAGPTAPRG